MAFTPLQQNWVWYENDAAEPTVSYANEGVAPSITNDPILRLRITVRNSGTTAGNNKALTVEYSLDDSSFVAFGSGNHWNYADGAAVGGGTTTTFKTSDATSHGVYHEDAATTESWAAGAIKESDVAIQATANVLRGQVYYFRLKQAGTAIPLGSGETHPSLLTALAGSVATGEVGTPEATAALALANGALAGSVGTPAPDSSLALSGFEATGSVGDMVGVSADITRPATGIQADGTTQAPSPEASVTQSGEAASSAVGQAALELDLAITGQPATGEISAPASGMSAAETGLDATGAVESPAVALSLTPAGLAASVTPGSVMSPGQATASLTGETASGSLEAFGPAIETVATGEAASGFFDTLLCEASLLILGADATAGFGTILVDTGGVAESLLGNLALGDVGDFDTSDTSWKNHIWADIFPLATWEETPIMERE